MSTEPAKDPGAHYRGPNIFGIPLDPYRILEAYPNITREPGRHIVKKILRMGKKGIDEKQLVAEIRCCLERWEQMLQEETAFAISGPVQQVLDGTSSQEESAVTLTVTAVTEPSVGVENSGT